ncbi:MAG: ABC transporter substrate-binding protein [Acidobacteriota bacterium]
MHSLRRLSSLDSIALWLLVVVAALSISCTATPDSRDTSRLIAGVIAPLETVNEVLSLGGSFNGAVFDQLFLSLVDEEPDFQSGPLTFTPRLATSWEFSDDRLQLTFQLRDDVVWSDGTPLTAEDVRYTWQAQISEHTGYGYAFAKETIRDVEVVDPHTVRFHYDEPSGTQFVDAVDGVILPKHKWGELPFEQWREQPEWFTENLVTSGPYMLENWKPAVSFELRANPLYYEEGLPKIERILFREVSETSSLFSQLLAGELDFIQTMRPADIAEAEAREDLQVLTHDQRQYTFISWNVGKPLFEDPTVRNAMTLAIDRDAIIETLWLGYANPGVTPVLSSTWAAHPDIAPLPYDPDQAGQLLDEAGWTDSDGDGVRDKDGVDFSFELATNTGNPQRWDTIQMVQAQLAKIGVQVKPARYDLPTINARTQAHDFDAAVIGLLIDTTLDNTVTLKGDATYNFGQYADAEMDQLLDEYAAALDKGAAIEKIHRIQEIFHRDQPMSVLWEPLGIRGLSANLKNATPSSSSDLWRLRHWEWSQD